MMGCQPVGTFSGAKYDVANIMLYCYTILNNVLAYMQHTILLSEISWDTSRGNDPTAHTHTQAQVFL